MLLFIVISVLELIYFVRYFPFALPYKIQINCTCAMFCFTFSICLIFNPVDSCRLDELISADHHLRNSYEVVVDGSNLTVECSGNWAFDLLGTKKLSVKCIHPIPSCSVRYCPQSCDGGFTCDSCQCVNTTSTARCDGVQHCSDGSDEMGCPVEG